MGNTLITREGQMPAFFDWLESKNTLAFDTETTGLTPYARENPSRICGFSVYADDGEGFYLPFRHGSGTNLPLWQLRSLMERLSDRIEAGDLTLTTWNGKFDLHMMQVDGFRLPLTGVRDAMFAAHLLNENEPSYALKQLSDRYLGDTSSLDERDLKGVLQQKLGITGKDWKGNLWRLPAEDVAAYAISDTRLTWELESLYWPALDAWDLTDLYYELSDYGLLLTRMEARGIRLDVNEIHRHMRLAEPELQRTAQSLFLRAEAIIRDKPEPPETSKTLHTVWHNERLRREDPEAFHELFRKFREGKVKKAPPVFNPGSPTQLQWVFGWEDTDKDFLEGLTEDHPDYDVAQDLLDYRVLSKMNGTYYDAYLSLIDRKGFLRPNYNITGTVNGRLSCSKPNIQNVPRYTDRRPVKDVFIPSEDNRSFLEVDYAQAELRIAAHYAEERELARVLKEGGDPHGMTAERMGVARHVGKTLNFAVIYGAGPKALMKLLHCDRPTAIDYLNGYFDLYPGFKWLSKATQYVAERDGYIRMGSGRYRHFRNPSTGRPYLEKKYNFKVPVETRKAMNSLIQGTASEMLRIGMMRLDWEIRQAGIDAHLLFQVHDSIMTEVRDDHIDALLPIVRAALTDFAFDPPPDIDAKIGKRWGQLKGIAI